MPVNTKKYTCKDHAETDKAEPARYGTRAIWFRAMVKDHHQYLCGQCHRWKVWVKK